MKACAHILDGLDGGFLLVLPRTHINKYRVAWARAQEPRRDSESVFVFALWPKVQSYVSFHE